MRELTNSVLRIWFVFWTIPLTLILIMAAVSPSYLRSIIINPQTIIGLIAFWSLIAFTYIMKNKRLIEVRADYKESLPSKRETRRRDRENKKALIEFKKSKPNEYRMVKKRISLELREDAKIEREIMKAEIEMVKEDVEGMKNSDPRSYVLYHIKKNNESLTPVGQLYHAVKALSNVPTYIKQEIKDQIGEPRTPKMKKSDWVKLFFASYSAKAKNNWYEQKTGQKKSERAGTLVEEYTAKGKSEFKWNDIKGRWERVK
jgi:hypothetical protein